MSITSPLSVGGLSQSSAQCRDCGGHLGLLHCASEERAASTRVGMNLSVHVPACMRTCISVSDYMRAHAARASAYVLPVHTVSEHAAQLMCASR